MKTRRRKLPVTAPCSSTLSPSNGKTNGRTAAHGSANPKSSARVIRRFHVLLKRKAQLEKGKKKGKERDAKLKRGSRKQKRLEEVRDDLNDTDGMQTDEMERELREIEDEMREMGGLEVYQRMSRIGQGKDRGGGSESVFIGWMEELGLRVRFEKEKGKEKMKCVFASSSTSIRIISGDAFVPGCSKSAHSNPTTTRAAVPGSTSSRSTCAPPRRGL